MVSKDKVYMPMGTGGLIRYTEEEKPLIKLKPNHLIGIIVAIVVFELSIRII